MKLIDFDHVIDYYNHISCEEHIKSINKPGLFINNTEDPICPDEIIPFDQLFKNPHLITLLCNRGGHVEYLSGLNKEWFGYKIALDYFAFFQEKYLRNKNFIEK